MSDLPTKRDSAFDNLKGILILCVILLHSSGRSAADFAIRESLQWWILRSINWVLCFAVPCFIFASAVLWTRSQEARSNWDGYFKRRIKSILWPYVVWTLLYWLFRLFVEHSLLADPGGISTFGRLQVRVRLYELFFGKAYFHLYFMFVMLQFAILFPALYIIGKKIRIDSIWLACLAAIGAQAAAFFIYSNLYSPLYNLVVFRGPSSYVLWYETSLVTGLWLGLHWEQWKQLPNWTGSIFAIIAAPFAVAVILLETGHVQGYDQPGFVYNGAIALLSMAMGFWLLSLARRITWPPLAYLGQISLQLYFLHPMVMSLMSRTLPKRIIGTLPLPAVWSLLILIAISIGLTELLRHLRLDGILFGREEKRAVRPSVATE